MLGIQSELAKYDVSLTLAVSFVHPSSTFAEFSLSEVPNQLSHLKTIITLRMIGTVVQTEQTNKPLLNNSSEYACAP